MLGERQPLEFGALVEAIRQVHNQMAAQAGKAVNISLTLRNWAIGRYIREYEQRGADRARYGETLLEALSEELARAGIGGVAARSLRLCRQFYLTYPQIRQTLSAESAPGLLGHPIWQSPSAKSGKGVPAPTTPGTGSTELIVPGQTLLERLSFSHFAELIAIDDPLKRAFYEIECIRGNWSVRALKRQIASLYCERSGLSRNKERLAELVKSGTEKAEPGLAVRDPYVFEFLGIKPRDVMAESDLEDALLDKLQDFLLELGHGFCFEARQKSILIGETHGFVDLVFYHRLGLSGSDKRMRDVALVLRFAAFYHSTYLNYRPPMTKFLNEDMARYQQISTAQANELESAFKNALGTIRSLLDRHAFKRYYRGTPTAPEGRWEPKKFNASCTISSCTHSLGLTATGSNRISLGPI